MGRAADHILHEAHQGDYDLLVIGERPGHRLIHRILANTVSDSQSLRPALCWWRVRPVCPCVC